MADSSSHTSTLPELYRLCNSLRSSHILGSTILAQRNPALLVHNNSQPAPENSLPSSTIPLNKPIPSRDQNPVIYAFLHGANHSIPRTYFAHFERISLLLQSQNEMLKRERILSPYKGIFDCFYRTIKHDGLLSLWRGNSLNLISPFTFEACMSAQLVILKRKGYLSEEDKERPLWNLCLDGVLATLGLLFIYPLNYAWVRLANDVKAEQYTAFSLDSSRSYSIVAGNRKFNGVCDVFKKTLRVDGCVGLYRGCTIACVEAFAFPAIEMINSHYIEKRNKEKHSYSYSYSTEVVTLWALQSLHVVTYPLYTISHRMMMTSGETTKYKGVADAVRQIVKHEGVSSLYRGLTLHLLIFPTSLYLMFCTAYEFTSTHLRDK